MPGILDVDKFCENLKEVSTVKLLDKRRFHPAGLFSEQIFGPVKNYTCQCGTYHGAHNSGSSCKICGVDIVNSLERRRRFGKIVLPFSVVNPLFYDLLCNLGGNQLKKIIDDLMKSEKSILIKDLNDDGTSDFYISETKVEGKESFERMEAIYVMIDTISGDLAKDGIKEWKMVKDNIHKLLIKNIIVLPSDLRPMAKGADKNNQVVDKINRYYQQIITLKETIKNTTLEIVKDKKIYYTYFKQLQKNVNELYEHIIVKLSKKEGLIRGNILGKRIDFSGRAVIVPEPSLKLDECSLPYLMVLELFKIQISKRLIDLRKFKLLNQAIDFVEKCIDMSDPSLFDICQEIVKNEVCILNRQPSLHRLSMVGFKIKTSLDKVIKIHPLVCPGFNADFDGDQMAVYIPISEKTKQEVLDRFISTKNLTDPSDNRLITTPSQDIVLGIYMLTTIDSQEVEYKGEKLSLGQKIFNECLPENYPLIKGSINKDKLSSILDDINNRYSEDVIAKVLDCVKDTGFKYSTVFGTSMSLKNINLENFDKIVEDIYKSENIQDQLMAISSKETEDLMRQNFKYSYLIDSGARGKWDQVRQIILTRGYISNFSGDILTTPIKHSLIEGLTQQEFFNSTYGCRKGLLDVAVNTGDSGYLSRKLVFSCANLTIDENLDDCGTKDYLDVFVETPKKAKMLFSRYFCNDKNELEKITSENYLSLVGKVIKLRSPIFCKSETLCHKCYGDSYKNIHSRFVGIIAAQSLGEKSTQLILRTFHTSGVAKVGKDQKDMKQSDIVGDLAFANKLFHNKEKKNYKELVDGLFDLYISTGNILHIHFECVVSQMMWKGFTKWRLLSNRDKITPDYYSIQTIPEKESWILGLGFSNPKRQILKGIVQSGHYKGILDKILLGEVPK